MTRWTCCGGDGLEADRPGRARFDGGTVAVIAAAVQGLGDVGGRRKRYREGQEDRLAALGLVLKAVVLWNTRYIDAALKALRAQGYQVHSQDAARLSPLVEAHLNVHGRYTFTLPTDDGLRPLRGVAEPAEEEYLRDGTFSPETFSGPGPRLNVEPGHS